MSRKSKLNSATFFFRRSVRIREFTFRRKTSFNLSSAAVPAHPSVDVMEHIEEDVEVFKNFYQSLKDGGVLLISTPPTRVVGMYMIMVMAFRALLKNMSGTV
jgi:2-polyprenyl-3-methyl-5-hydroxy-6-metoxy-1,4-benzoquinol methylase